MSETVSIPLGLRVHLAHAVAQALADEAGADVLHLKGPAVAAELRDGIRASSDVDLLIRPAHLTAYLRTLSEHGWSKRSEFDEGSAFGHAANWFHEDWGYIDVHRSWPGPRRGAVEVFDRLWRDRQETVIAGRVCLVPDLVGQSLVLILHAARSAAGRDNPDVVHAWELRDEVHRRAVRTLARELDADVALAAGLGDIDEHRGEPDYLLWRAHSAPNADQLDDWVGRMQAARTVPEKAAVAARALRPNQSHLRMRIGRTPTRREMAAEGMIRVGRAARLLLRRARR